MYNQFFTCEKAFSTFMDMVEVDCRERFTYMMDEASDYMVHKTEHFWLDEDGTEWYQRESIEYANGLYQYSEMDITRHSDQFSAYIPGYDYDDDESWWEAFMQFIFEEVESRLFGEIGIQISESAGDCFTIFIEEDMMVWK